MEFAQRVFVTMPTLGPSTINLAEVPRRLAGTCRLDDVPPLGLPPRSVSRGIITGRSNPKTFVKRNDLKAFTFSETDAFHPPFDFQTQVRPSPCGIKRKRHTQDVDGPNTAALYCKKRRLRADLITSRLSQPFSQPATHILNREGLESGDKRFLKMATSVEAAKRTAQLHATSFLRFSVMNRLRKRLGVVRPGLPRPNLAAVQSGQMREMDATARAPWKPQSLQVASGATYWQPSSPQGPSTPAPSPGFSNDRTVANTPRTVLPLPRVSKPMALPLPPGDLAATKERTAPRIDAIRSPELRPDTLAPDEEEDSFAFLHPDYDDEGDDPEHVYSDFGAIFGGRSPEPQSGDDGSYEEYLDELDGISWTTR